MAIKITQKHALFYTEWPSNFRKTRFLWGKGIFNSLYNWQFFCTEQAFMWAKAICFNDNMIAAQILAEKTEPRKCKELGREVHNYDDKVWSKNRYKIMLSCNYARFTQDPILKSNILDKKFDGKVFVEASPYDEIWGIGIEQSDPMADDESKWYGQNLMGKVITEVRSLILQGKQP